MPSFPERKRAVCLAWPWPARLELVSFLEIWGRQMPAQHCIPCSGLSVHQRSFTNPTTDAAFCLCGRLLKFSFFWHQEGNAADWLVRNGPLTIGNSSTAAGLAFSPNQFLGANCDRKDDAPVLKILFVFTKKSRKQSTIYH